jgi:hypothetical protein
VRADLAKIELRGTEEVPSGFVHFEPGERVGYTADPDGHLIRVWYAPGSTATWMELGKAMLVLRKRFVGWKVGRP